MSRTPFYSLRSLRKSRKVAAVLASIAFVFALAAPASAAVQAPTMQQAVTPVTTATPIFANVSATFAWQNNAAGIGVVTVVNSGAPVPINAVDTRVNGTWIPCKLANGTVLGISSNYPSGTTQCIVTGLQNGDMVWAAVQGVNEFFFNFTVSGVLNSAPITPTAPKQVGNVITIPAAQAGVQYVVNGAGHALQPGQQITLGVNQSLTVMAVQSVPPVAPLTGQTSWTFDYVAPAPSQLTPVDLKQVGNLIVIPSTTGYHYEVGGQPVSGTVYVPKTGLTITAVSDSVPLVGKTSWTFTYATPPPPNQGTTKETICHETGSATNPYVSITVSVASLNDKSDKGHGGHDGDIWPSFTYQAADDLIVTVPAHNWTATTAKIYAAGCKVEAPTPPPSNGGNGGDDHGGNGGNSGGGTTGTTPGGTTTGSSSQTGGSSTVVTSGSTTTSTSQSGTTVSSSASTSADRSWQLETAATAGPSFEMQLSQLLSIAAMALLALMATAIPVVAVVRRSRR